MDSTVVIPVIAVPPDLNKRIILRDEPGVCYAAFYPNMGEMGEIEVKKGPHAARFDLATVYSPGFDGNVLYAHEVADSREGLTSPK